MTYSERKAKVLEYLGFFWTEVFRDEDFVDGYAEVWTQLSQRFQQQFAVVPDFLAREDVPVRMPRGLRLFTFSEADRQEHNLRYGDTGVFYDGTRRYGDRYATVIEYRYACDSAVQPGWLCSSVLEPAVVLRKGLDYVFEDGYVVFRQDPLDQDGVPRDMYADSDGNPLLEAVLWGFETDEDIEAVQNCWGFAAGVLGSETSDLLKEAVNLAFTVKQQGNTVEAFDRVLALVTGTDYAESAGVVQAVFDEGDCVCVETADAVYAAPSTAEVLVAERERFARGARLFNTYEVYRGTEVPGFDSFEGLTLGSGFLSTAFEGGLFFDNNLVDITTDAAGRHTFRVGGLPGDVETLMDVLNTSTGSGSCFFDMLQDKYGTMPAQLNPFQEVRDLLLRNNVVFAKIRNPISDSTLVAQMFRVLHDTFPAGGTFVLLEEQNTLADGYSTGSASETLEAFYAFDLDDETNAVAASVQGAGVR